ncbi:MAG: phospholipid carrier-dependent glycosyltransferase [Candidatus Ancillula sp.]|nr:phospholipid carrier-dependent glycosyltransferase [Candidatus Ancillula sp.]
MNRPKALSLYHILLVLLVVFATSIRLYNLAYPNTLYFDETYYVKDAYAQQQTGFSREWEKNVDPKTNANLTDEAFAQGEYKMEEKPNFAVHPPFGKTVIGAGIELGGVKNSFSWRISTAILGILSVFVLVLSAKRLFLMLPRANLCVGKFISLAELFALFTGFIFCIDGQAIVMSRIGILDSNLAFFVVCAFYFLVVYCSNWKQNQGSFGFYTLENLRREVFPNLRYELLVAVLCGLASGIKWSGLYFLLGFGAIILVLEFLKNKFWYTTLNNLVKSLLIAIKMLVIFGCTYLVCYIPWFLTPTAYGRSGSTNPLVVIQEFFAYHISMLKFHTHLESTHAYAAKAIGWLLQLRPTSFYYKTPADCGSSECSAHILALGNPFIWWFGLITLAVLISVTILRPSLIKVLCIMPIAMGYLPWVLLYSNRTIFTFYSIVFCPYIALAIFFVLLNATVNASTRKSQRVWLFATTILCVVFLAVSVYFYPIWTGMHIPKELWQNHMWLQSWI